MKVLRNARELGSLEGPMAAAIGVFDGLHLGHQSVIHRAARWAGEEKGSSVVVTFDRHPNEIVSPSHAPPAIYPLAKKLQVLSHFKTDAVLLLPFDEPFSRKSAAEFVLDILGPGRQLRQIYVGKDFVFGHRRSGSLESLQAMGREHGFTATGLPPILFEGTPVSSTRIRNAIRTGDFHVVDSLLGRPYSLSGKVIEGDRIGRTLGFPTANLDATRLALPPFGVYAVHAAIEDRTFHGVLSIGVRPTLNAPIPQTRVEVHLLGFSGDLYGKNADLFFIRKLRDEKRFDSLAALQAQIAADIAGAKAAFNPH